MLSQLGGFGWRDIGDTLALYFSIFSGLMHEADAFSLAKHLLLTCHTLLETVFLFFLFFFVGYRGDVHPLTAKHRQRHRTNLICAGTTA